MSRTKDNLRKSADGEAFARLKYIAYAQKAMEEGYPEIAQLFEEAAGAETIHGVSHLKALNFIKSTKENLEDAVYGEQDEIDEMYPRFIKEAEEDQDEFSEKGAKSFKLAMDREDAHKKMFTEALKKLNEGIK